MGTTNLDRLELGGVEITPPITEPVIKTVGAGKDFEYFDDALRWASKIPTAGFGEVKLVLDDGIHELDILNSGYIILTNKITISSDSGVSANCTITFGSGDYTNSYAFLIYVRAGGDVTLFGVGFNPEAGVATNTGTETAVGSLGYIGGNDVRISNCRVGLDVGSGGTGNVSGLKIDACEVGLLATTSSSISAGSSPSVTNCTTYGIRALSGGRVIFHQGVTLTGNTADSEIPLNEIQYDGSYVTNGTSAISFKA